MHRYASRALLVAPLILFAVTASTTAGAATHPPAPWSQNDANGAQSRANLTETTLTPATIGRAHYLRSVVSRPVGADDPCGSGVQAPVLAAGRIYQVEAGYLTSRSASTGKLVWTAPPQVPAVSDYYSVVVVKSTVLMSYSECISQTNVRSYVEAYSTSSGALLWRDRLPGWLSPLVASGGYVVEDGNDGGYGTHTVSVIRVSDGSGVWGDECQGTPVQLLIVAQNVIYQCRPDDPENPDAPGSVVAHHLVDGALAWSAADGTVLRGDTDAASGRHVFLRRAGGVDDVNPVTGATRFTLADAHAVLAVDKQRAYATCPDGVCAYSLSTGSRTWAVSPQDGDVTTAAEAGGLLYLGNGDVLNAASGAFLRRLFSADGGATVVVGDGRVGVVADPRILDLYGLSGW